MKKLTKKQKIIGLITLGIIGTLGITIPLIVHFTKVKKISFTTLSGIKYKLTNVHRLWIKEKLIWKDNYPTAAIKTYEAHFNFRNETKITIVDISKKEAFSLNVPMRLFWINFWKTELFMKNVSDFKLTISKGTPKMLIRLKGEDIFDQTTISPELFNFLRNTKKWRLE